MTPQELTAFVKATRPSEYKRPITPQEARIALAYTGPLDPEKYQVEQAKKQTAGATKHAAWVRESAEQAQVLYNSINPITHFLKDNAIWIIIGVSILSGLFGGTIDGTTNGFIPRRY